MSTQSIPVNPGFVSAMRVPGRDFASADTFITRNVFGTRFVNQGIQTQATLAYT
jgi:hypothetical protein